MSEEYEDIIINSDELVDEALLADYEDNSEVYDVVRSYLKELEQYPLLSDEETDYLIMQYKLKGDMDAREKLINHNLRLGVWAIKHRRHVTKSYEFIDLVQTASLGIIQAVDRFDMNNGALLSTFMVKCIYTKVHRDLAENDRAIRYPVYFITLMFKYNRFKRDFFNEHGYEATIDEICEYLGVDEAKVKEIEHILMSTDDPDSLNRELKNTDHDASFLEEFVEDTNVTGFADFDNYIDDKILLDKLKKNLPEQVYYALYHNVLAKNKMNLRDVADRLGVSHTRVQQLIDMAFNRIKKTSMFKRYKGENLNYLTKVDVKPIDFPKKVIILYLKERVTEEEYSYLYDIYFLGQDPEVFMRKYHIKESTFREFREYMEDNFKEFLNPTRELYTQIVQNVKQKYTISQIFAMDISPVVDNSLEVKERIDALTKEELIASLGDEYDKLTSEQKKLIDDYYDNSKYTNKGYATLLNAKINLALLGYKEKKNFINNLYKTYLNNKDLFDREYQEFLEGVMFRDITGKKVCYDYTFGRRKNITILRLAQLYYKIDNYFSYELPSAVIAKVLEEYDYLFTEDEIKGLKLHYLNPEGNLNYKELMEVFHMKKSDITALLVPSYARVVSLYLGVYRNTLIKNEDIYMKYVNDPNFPLLERTREVCRLRFDKHLDYKEIGEILGIEDDQDKGKKSKTTATQKVSNILNKATFLIDCHHYNVNNDSVYEEDKILAILNTRDKYTELEKKIIIEHFINKREAPEVCKNYKIDKPTYHNLLANFHHTYLRTYAKSPVTKQDIERELLLHSSDCILNDTQRVVLAYYAGIKCDYNRKGEILDKEKIKSILGLDENGYKNSLTVGLLLIGSKIAGIIGSSLGRLTRDDVSRYLKDANIPLSNKEKELLKSIKGIEGETLSLEDIAKRDNVNIGSVKRRVMRAYVAILKYADGLNDKKIDYEKDVLPRLKYFPLIEQVQLKEMYKDELPTSYFMEKYHLTKEQAWALMGRLEKRINYLIKYRFARKFDFDYAREVLDKKDLPFYGDYDVARTYYDRYFGDDGLEPERRSELVEDLNLNEEFKTSAMLRNLMVSVLMYKDGYRKPKTISIDEVKNYYERNKDNISPSKQKLFLSTIRINNPDRVNETVAYEILKERGEVIFDIESISQDEAINLIRENPYKLTDSQLNFIRAMHNIPKRYLMSGKSKHKLYKLVEPYVLTNNGPRKKLENKR